jgi:acetyl esterase/lipase
MLFRAVLLPAHLLAAGFLYAAAPLPEGTRVMRDLPYVTGGHERQKLDLYLPASGAKWPLIVAVHGGAWMAGSKESEPAGIFVARGFAVAAINYRLSQHAIFPAQIEDCKAAVRWLRANASQYGFDPARVGAIGGSAGGHLVAMLGVAGDVREFEKGDNLDQSSRVQAVVDMFGPTDFLQMDAHRPAAARQVHDDPNSPESRLVGGHISRNREAVARANPITYVKSGLPPFLLIHGDEDLLVPHHQSELLLEALKKAGVQAELMTVRNGPHGGATVRQGLPRAVEFFVTRLRP